MPYRTIISIAADAVLGVACLSTDALAYRAAYRAGGVHAGGVYRGGVYPGVSIAGAFMREASIAAGFIAEPTCAVVWPWASELLPSVQPS